MEKWRETREKHTVKQNRGIPHLSWMSPIWQLVPIALYLPNLPQTLRLTLAQSRRLQGHGSYLGLYWNPGAFCLGFCFVPGIQPQPALPLPTQAWMWPLSWSLRKSVLTAGSSLPHAVPPGFPPLGSPVIQPINTSVLPAYTLGFLPSTSPTKMFLHPGSPP